MTSSEFEVFSDRQQESNRGEQDVIDQESKRKKKQILDRYKGNLQESREKDEIDRVVCKEINKTNIDLIE